MTNIYLNGGVLIIGSLYWQDDGGRKGDNRRKNWRREHLEMTQSSKVLAPFRYGRVSANGVYTMTFSNSVRRKPGTAIVVPFLSNPLQSFATLRAEAEALSHAEGMQGRFIKCDAEGRPWSVIGILPNPGKLAVKQRTKLTIWWAEQLQVEGDFDRFDPINFRLGKEKPSVLSSGQLNIPWPTGAIGKDQEKLKEYDFLIAAATLPTGGKYPTVTEMKKNIDADTERNYFRHNYEKGIYTFQDERIQKKLNSSRKQRQELNEV